MTFVTDIQKIELNVNPFDCLTMQKEVRQITKERQAPSSYFVTYFPRYPEFANPFQFVYGLFDFDKVAFSPNQLSVLNLANEMFNYSISLSKFEEEVLNYTFNRLVKKNPSLPNRS
jgi:hypothetical protein